MINSPEVMDLNQDDLNQRFLETQVAYDGKIKFVSNIMAGDPPRIMFGLEDDFTKLDWKKLNLERPLSRWCITERGEVFYPYAVPKRQWRRGWVYGANWEYYLMGGHPDKHEVLDEWIHGKVAKKQVIQMGLLNQVKQFLLGPQLLWFGGVFYYRKRKIARYGGNDRIIIDVPHFEPELREHIPDAVFAQGKEERPREQQTTTANKAKLIELGRELGVEAQAFWAPPPPPIVNEEVLRRAHEEAMRREHEARVAAVRKLVVKRGKVRG